MHPLETAAGVPAFLAKLWRLVEDKETNDLISWSSDGRSFIIQNQAKFSKELLPLNYKHNNMASFIRQLNMYGFHKITSIDNGGLKFDKDEMEFSHPYFQKGHPYLLEHIKRKIANTKQETEKYTTKSTDTFSRVLSEVKNMNRRQDTLDSRFSNMKQENEALWREVAILRQKHLKQQQIVNKLIQFLVTIVQPTRTGLAGSRIGKRRGQLMINDVPQSKVRKNNMGPIISELTEELLLDGDSDLEDVLVNADGSIMSPGSHSSKEFDSASYSGENSAKLDAGLADCDLLTGDEIDEIDTSNMAVYSGSSKKDRCLNSKVESSTATVGTGYKSQKSLKKAEDNGDSTTLISVGESLLNSTKSTEQTPLDVDTMLNVLNDPTGGQAASSSLMSNQIDQSPKDDDQISGDVFKNIQNDSMTLTKYNPNSNHDILQLNSVDEYSSHLDNVQNDLDSLKDLLRGDSYCFDANTLVENDVSMPTRSNSQYDVNLINKLFDGTDLVGYEMSPSNMDLFTDEKKDENSQAVAGISNLSYQPTSGTNDLDINEFLDNVCDESKLTN